MTDPRNRTATATAPADVPSRLATRPDYRELLSAIQTNGQALKAADLLAGKDRRQGRGDRREGLRARFAGRRERAGAPHARFEAARPARDPWVPSVRPTAPSFTLSCTARLVEDVTDFSHNAFNDYAMFYNMRFRLEPMEADCEVRVVISDLEVIQNGRVVWRDRHQLPLGCTCPL